MRLKKRYLILTLVLIVAIATGAYLWTWFHAAPQSVRLLPDSDAVAYVNLRPLRVANVFASLNKINHAPEYEDFIQQSGVDFERDLSEVAVAIHLPATTTASVPPTASDIRFSWIFKGSIDRNRLSAYLRKISRSTEIYSGKEIFTVPIENRLVRAVFVSDDEVAVSNVDDPQIIHQIIDRASAWWSLPAKSTLVRNHYKDVPLGSLAWLIGNYSSSGTGSGLGLPGGFDVSLPDHTTWVLSLRYAGSIELQAQALTMSADDARKIADTLGTFLSLFRSLQTNVGTPGPDADVKAVFDSLQVTQEDNRTILSAEIPIGFIRKIAQQGPAAITGKTPEPQPVPTPKKKLGISTK